MRQISSLRLLPLMLLLASVSAVVFPVEVIALGGICGGVIPCECGDRLVTSRTLVAGVDPVTVTRCPGDGLVIEDAADLTLDLNGNTIRAAAGAGGGSGIILNLSSRITVTGGTIVGFRDLGIFVRLSNHNRFSFLQIVEGGEGIAILGDANTVERCVFRRQGGTAIFAEGEGTQVLTNRIEDSQFDGARLVISPTDFLPDLGPAVIARNVILRSGGTGLDVDSSIPGTLVDHNQVSRSGGDGLVLSGSDLTVSRNVAKDNAGDGFFVEATDSTFDRNQSLSNGGYGIEDTTQGDGTADTANTYTLNSCSSANVLGKSSPASLCR